MRGGAGPDTRDLQGPLLGSRAAGAAAAASARMRERQGREAGQDALEGPGARAPALAPGPEAACKVRTATTSWSRSREQQRRAAEQGAFRAHGMCEPTRAPAGDADELLRDLGLDSPEATQAGSTMACQVAAGAAPEVVAGAASGRDEELAAVLARYDDSHVAQVLPWAAWLLIEFRPSAAERIDQPSKKILLVPLMADKAMYLEIKDTVGSWSCLCACARANQVLRHCVHSPELLSRRCMLCQKRGSKAIC